MAKRAGRHVALESLERIALLERRVEWLLIALAVALLALISYLPFADVGGQVGALSGRELASAS